MTFPLEILLLGGLQTRLEGQPVTAFASRKAEALLAYLACTGKPQPREVLADLFWDDRSTAQALGNLRVLLSSLRKLFDDRILINRQNVALAPQACQVDALAFEQATSDFQRRANTGGRLCDEEIGLMEAALRLYQGDFFFGIYLRDASRFMEWVAMQRERFHLMALDTMYSLVTHAKTCGDYETGLRWADRILQIDKLREEAHREKMLLLARSGRREAALEQYRLCRQALADGLGLEPDAETEALYRRLQQSRAATRLNLPPQATPFVGRQPELERIAALLRDPAARLITLCGPGGMGKTRLALQAVADNAAEFLQGAAYIALTEPTDAAALALALADALQLSPAPKETARAALLRQLRGREILLVFDAFEHYQGEAHLFSELLNADPGVKLLITARLPLSLRSEWLVEVTGLEPPPAGSPLPCEQSPAGQLFLQTARRVRPDFAITPANAADVRTICSLVMGSPLGIELAAGWVHLLSPAEIAQAIRSDLDVLAADEHDAPPHQRSLRGVLNPAWALLSPAAQQTLARLAVCRGGFTWLAARAIADANLPVLAELARHSFVHRLPQERYVIHDLLRQYALEKAGQSPELLAESTSRHAAYYLNWLAGQYTALNGPEQAASFSQISLELDNLRAAWHCALDMRHFDLAAQAADSLAAYFENAGHFSEGLTLFERLAQALPQEHQTGLLPSYAASAHYRGWFTYRLGNLAQAVPWLENSLAQYRQYADLPGQASALCALAMVSLQRGDAARALALSHDSLAHYQQANDILGQGRALNILGVIAKQQGRLTDARQFHEQALALHRLLGDPNRIAGSLNNLGIVARALGQPDEAVRFYREALQLRRQGQNRRGISLALVNLANVYAENGDYAFAAEAFAESLSICESIGDDWGRSLALHNLGDLALNLGNSGLAAERYHQSLALRRQIGDPPGVAYSLAGLGRARLAQGDLPAAHQHLTQAIQQALQLNLQPAVLGMLVNVADLLTPGQPDNAYKLACYLHAHPAADEQTRRRAAETLTALDGQISNSERDTLRQQAEQASLAEMAAWFADVGG